MQRRLRESPAPTFVLHFTSGSAHVHFSHLTPSPHPRTQDPLGLGKTDSSLERFTEAELMNGRWAMLGIAGALGAEVLGFGDWYNAPLWVRAD